MCHNQVMLLEARVGMGLLQPGSCVTEKQRSPATPLPAMGRPCKQGINSCVRTH